MSPESANPETDEFGPEKEFTSEHEAYLRHELQRGIDELDRGQYAEFDAKKIIAEMRARSGT